MPANITGTLVTSQGKPLGGALVTFFPLEAPFADPFGSASIPAASGVVTSAVVKTRTAPDGSFSQSLIGGTELLPVPYRLEFSELDRLRLALKTNTGTVNIGTIVLP